MRGAGEGGGGNNNDKVLRSYGRDILKYNGERLLAFSEGQLLALLKTYFRTPKHGVSYIF